MLKLPAELGTGGTIILGPSLAASMTETTVASLMNDHNLPLGHVEEWLQYYRGLAGAEPDEMVPCRPATVLTGQRTSPFGHRAAACLNPS